MRILLTILLCNLVLGAAMALYLAVIWRKCKSPIAEHGWNPECADPICGNMWLLCFVPIFGILYYLVAGETVGILAATDKASVNGIVSIKYGPLAFSYDEDHKLDYLVRLVSRLRNEPAAVLAAAGLRYVLADFKVVFGTELPFQKIIVHGRGSN